MRTLEQTTQEVLDLAAKHFQLPAGTLAPADDFFKKLGIDATGVKINWDVQEAGVDIMAKKGTPIPDETLASIRRTKCALKSPITTPVGTGFRSINVYLRQELGLFACIRPCKQYPGVRTFFDRVPIDIVIVRENTEDLYAGVEFEAGKPDTIKLIDFINGLPSDKKIKTTGSETGVRRSSRPCPCSQPCGSSGGKTLPLEQGFRRF